MSESVGLFPPGLAHDPVRLSLDCLREGFQIIGFDWTYVYVNPAAARHGRRERRGPDRETDSAKVYPGIERTRVFEPMRKCMAERTSYVLENEFTFPDGTRQWFELRIQPVPAGICIYSSDINDRKQREQGCGPAANTGTLSGWWRRLVGR